MFCSAAENQNARNQHFVDDKSYTVSNNSVLDYDNLRIGFILLGISEMKATTVSQALHGAVQSRFHGSWILWNMDGLSYSVKKNMWNQVGYLRVRHQGME